MITRTLILILCRLMNFAILLISPIFLVRILDVRTYGQYREFILYAMLFAQFIGFSIKNNLLYFIPKMPWKERECVTQTAILIFAVCLMGSIIIIISKNWILAKTSYDFVVPLIIYVFFFLNMDIWESYWLGKKRSDIVLYYSSLRTLFRVAVIIICAYLTLKVEVIIWSMIIVEIIRFAFVFFFFIGTKKFSKNLDFKIIKNQLSFIIPIGIASTIFYFNNRLGQLFISVKLGVNFLAIYTIGSYKVPILNIIRGSVRDVIFPEMVQRNLEDPIKGIKLWQKKNLIHCFFSFPLFLILFVYAETFITTIFTESYAEATPIFRIYLIYMLRQNFEMTSPLRSINKNKPFVFANIIALTTNLILMFTLYKMLGFLGPALAFILSDFVQASYLSILVSRHFNINLKDLFTWNKVIKLGGFALIFSPILLIGHFLNINKLLEAIVLSLCYLGFYACSFKLLRFEEIDTLYSYIKSQILLMCKFTRRYKKEII